MKSFIVGATGEFKLASSQGLGLLVLFAIALNILYSLTQAIYLAYFHPLSRIPGPKIAACSRLPYIRYLLKGDLVHWLHELHQKYGDVVRIAPDEVSFISGETAWQDIYGLHTGEKAAKGKYLKDRRWFAEPYNNTWSLLQADADAHPRMRKLMSPAFTDKALRDQEGIIQGYVSLIIQRLHEQVEEKSQDSVDMVRWYNYFTFDIIADLVFGESFHCLRDSDYHPWVKMLFSSVRAISINSAIRRYPMWQRLVKRLAPKDILEKRRTFNMWVFDRVSQRLAMDTARPDLMSHITNKQGPNGMTRDELDSNANIMLVAGSETTATLLSGCTYLLLKNPDHLAKLQQEIRSTFKEGSEVTIQSVTNLPYLNAVLNEALRIYPPNAAGFMRIVPGNGDYISGRWIPGGTAVSLSQWPANHSTRNFTSPEIFAPERFLGDEKYKDDNKAVLNPFSFGPRNCIGKGLALAEMRLLTTRLLLDFDLELVDHNQDWFDQKIFTLWEKHPLMVRLKPVQS